MTQQLLRPEHLSEVLSGRQVSRLSAADESRLEVHFTDGSSLIIQRAATGLSATISESHPTFGTQGVGSQPTHRQLEYLRFITKYILRFGRPPAESDIQKHFLVSAPSVNSMVQTLERRGFITRQPGVARSICVCFAVPEEAVPAPVPSSGPRRTKNREA